MIRNTLFLLISATALISAIGCSSAPEAPEFQAAKALPSYSQASFGEYINETQAWLESNRVFLTQDKYTELGLVAPQEFRPLKPNGQGVLLVHGLGDSPYSFIDIATHLAKQGYLVRTILLPGHGSKVGDLQLPTFADWQGIVKHHIQLLKQDTDSIWLGGYSTGANLVTEQAIDDESINGLLLFSPALQPLSGVVKYAKLASYFITWADQDPEDNPLRYNSLPMNAAAVYYQTSSQVRASLAGKIYDKPVFIMMSEGDKVIDTQYVTQVFANQMTHPASHLVWQGEQDTGIERTTRYSMRLPDLRISNGSHMGLLFSPDNPYYGQHGTQRICSNGQGEELEPKCSQSQVWYSAWGYREQGKIHARLTYNPYFAESMSIMDKVMAPSS
ncbi:alpha/beta hydrolase [Vibrio sinaloensis]|uniref:alpha/beta hydrolase n=1 Tax=Photobacterium sp. (strain ATCC 43367) TaxID=379097 RepID=UPI00206DBC36|nr:alpha/beta fold hydrolase [Vibrio sinaloensis]UPQ89608.1 alpha/beta fold hydrolase [Vibrio sinaloensis]